MLLMWHCLMANVFVIILLKGFLCMFVHHGQGNRALCSLSGYVFYMTTYNSTFFLTAVSVGRYLGVAFPIRHFLRRCIVFIVPFIGQDESLNSTSPSGTSQKEVCYKNFTEAQLQVLLPVRLEACIVLFCIPFLISSFCYINFIRILSQRQHIDRRRRLRAIGMALGTLVVFALCFGPLNVSHIIGYITNESPAWRDKALLCSTFNACLDPFIFYFSSSAVRGTVGKVVEGVKNSLSRCMSCHMFQASQRGINRTTQDKKHKQSETNLSELTGRELHKSLGVSSDRIRY
uniref:G-protein coupled receptors family 1 profile domain-containing protein n=1 Tax=Oryzias latipes TaxID=8090 RepID=A0A3P9MHV5_ORYLA